MIEELFKPIPNYEEYQASNLGNVLGSKFKRPLKPTKHKCGYLMVELCKNGDGKMCTVHRLIALTFLGESKLQVDHINGIKTDNRLENLRYCTIRENQTYRREKESNSSKYIGVCLDRRVNKWKARIEINNKRIHLGYFNCELKAHDAYQNKLKEIQSI